MRRYHRIQAPLKRISLQSVDLSLNSLRVAANVYLTCIFKYNHCLGILLPLHSSHAI